MINDHQIRFQEFQEFWAEYDDGSGTIAPEQLQSLLIRTDPPLGLGRMATGRDVLKFVFNLDIPLVNGRVPFHRTVYELVRNVSETQIPEVLLRTYTAADCIISSQRRQLDMNYTVSGVLPWHLSDTDFTQVIPHATAWDGSFGM